MSIEATLTSGVIHSLRLSLIWQHPADKALFLLAMASSDVSSSNCTMSSGVTLTGGPEPVNHSRTFDQPPTTISAGENTTWTTRKGEPRLEPNGRHAFETYFGEIFAEN